MERVPARLDREVEYSAGPCDFTHRARRPELELIEAAVVEIAAVAGTAVAHDHTFNQGAGRLVVAVGGEAGLSAEVRSSDVLARHLEARRERHGGPDVAGHGYRAHDFVGEARPLGRGHDVDGRGTGHDLYR